MKLDLTKVKNPTIEPTLAGVYIAITRFHNGHHFGAKGRTREEALANLIERAAELGAATELA